MIRFLKMHGLGNDFVVFDARKQALALEPSEAKLLADRRLGVGCDQIIVIAGAPGADAHMRILNADGSEAEACGNAARCVARLLMEEMGGEEIRLDTRGALLLCRDAGAGLVSVDMGAPTLVWDKIPLLKPADTNGFALNVDGTPHLVSAVSMGNPHCVLFVEDAEAAPVASLGPRIETHPMFPARTNVEFASVVSRQRLRLRVWERGAGMTRACGSGACATVVAAHRRGLTDDKVEVELDGGVLAIELRDGHVLMTGPASLSFRGEVDIEGLRS
jgi:diaminopimelate epimerase